MYDLIHIVIPFYNEGENIKSTLDEIKNKLKAFHKVFMILDFDEDNTIPIVKSVMKKMPT